MGQPELSQVINWLSAAGYRVNRGFPGERMPRIQWPAIAVSIHRQESDRESRTISVVVCSPTGQGGNTCEEVAATVTELLVQHGASCVQEACQYDNWGNYFSVRILATWIPISSPNFTVKIGTAALAYITEFTAEQEILRTPIGAMGQTQPIGTLVNTGPWQLTLVEEFPQGVHGISTINEPFTVNVFRGQGKEVYHNCYWLGTQRADGISGMRQTRKAVAGERSVTISE